MKRTRLIAVAIAVAIMVTGAGYAAWTDSLTTNHTVSTGDLNLDFTRGELLPYPFLTGGDGTPGTPGNYLNLPQPTISSDKKTLTVSIGGMYPNTYALYAARFDNTGSLPAILSDVSVDYATDNALLKQNLIVSGGYMQFDSGNNYKNGNFFVGTLGTLQDNLNNMLKNIKMERGDYITLDIPDNCKERVKEAIPLYNPASDNCLVFYLPGSVDNSLKLQNVVFDIRINFKQ